MLGSSHPASKAVGGFHLTDVALLFLAGITASRFGHSMGQRDIQTSFLALNN